MRLGLSLAMPLLASTGACVTAKGYEGPRRPDGDLALIVAGPPLFRSSRLVEPEIELIAVDGLDIEPRKLPLLDDPLGGTVRARVEPGERRLEALAWGPGTATGGLRRTLVFEARAGETLRVLYGESEHDVAGFLRVETQEGAVLASSEPQPSEVAGAELPAQARGWLAVGWYRDEPASYLPSAWSASYVPPGESRGAWTRRLELACYRTSSERPPLEAVAIDLERCLRSRFAELEWAWSEERGADSGEALAVRWRAPAKPAEVLEGLTVVRRGERRAYALSFAVRGRAMEEDEARAWAEALLAARLLVPREVQR